MAYILALDQGTTSSRAILFDHDAQPVAVAQQEFEQHFPRPGHVEHDAQEIWQTQLAVAREAIKKAGTSASAIQAIGITNQRETTIVWDRDTGKPIHRAIVWQDRRTAPMCQQLADQGHAATFQKRTGLRLDPYFAGTKIRWILDHVDGARDRAKQGKLAFGTVDAWLLWNLTKGQTHATDATNAARTLLYNIHDGTWDDALLDLLRVPREMLPEVRRSGESFDQTADGIFDKPIPIAGVAGDQQAALFGQLCTKPGMAKNTYGTGCFLLLHTGNQPIDSKNKLLTTRACSLVDKPAYALEGSIFTAGATIQWLRDQLGIIKSAPDVEALAGSVDDHGGVYLVPAFAGLGAPDWDPDARGLLIGLTRGSSAGHIARAALESIAFQVADVLKAMRTDSGQPIAELRVDGGASANDLLMQIQADLAQVPVVRPAVQETTALGAAYLAGLGVGFWSGIDELKKHTQMDRRFEPKISENQAQQRRQRWRKAVDRAGHWAQDNDD